MNLISYSIANYTGYTVLSAVHPSSTTAISAVRVGATPFYGTTEYSTVKKYRITTVQVYLRKYGSPSGTLRVRLTDYGNLVYLESTNTISMASLTTSWVLYTFTFPEAALQARSLNGALVGVFVESATTINSSNSVYVAYGAYYNSTGVFRSNSYNENYWEEEDYACLLFMDGDLYTDTTCEYEGFPATLSMGMAFAPPSHLIDVGTTRLAQTIKVLGTHPINAISLLLKRNTSSSGYVHVRLWSGNTEADLEDPANLITEGTVSQLSLSSSAPVLTNVAMTPSIVTPGNYTIEVWSDNTVYVGISYKESDWPSEPPYYGGELYEVATWTTYVSIHGGTQADIMFMLVGTIMNALIEVDRAGSGSFAYNADIYRRMASYFTVTTAVTIKRIGVHVGVSYGYYSSPYTPKISINAISGGVPSTEIVSTQLPANEFVDMTGSGYLLFDITPTTLQPGQYAVIMYLPGVGSYIMIYTTTPNTWAHDDNFGDDWEVFDNNGKLPIWLYGDNGRLFDSAVLSEVTAAHPKARIVCSNSCLDTINRIYDNVWTACGWFNVPLNDTDTYYMECMVAPSEEKTDDNDYIFGRIKVTGDGNTRYFPSDSLYTTPVRSFAAGDHLNHSAQYLFMIPGNLSGLTVTLELRIGYPSSRNFEVRTYLVGWGHSPHSHGDATES